IAVHAAILLWFHIPPLRYLAIYFAFGFTWSAMQYVHHAGTERHVTRGAKNLWLWGPIDLLWLNHGWHQTHHLHPTAPWIALPALGRAEDSRPTSMLNAYFQMWRGPRYSNVHVKNHYAGRIIR